MGFLFAPPILAFGFTSLYGDFGLVWQITGAYTFIYFALIFAYSKYIFTKIDRICLDAQISSPEHEIVFPTFWESYKKTIARETFYRKIAICFFSAFGVGISFLIVYSAVFDIYFLQNLGFHWVAAFLFGLFGVIMFGMPIAAAIHNILEKRAGKKNV